MTPRAWAEMALLALNWGGSFVANRAALDGLGVMSVVAIRVLGGGLLLWLWVWLRGLPVPRDARLWGAFLVMGAINNAIPFSLITWGQLTIPSGLAAILNAATAILGVLVAAAAFRDETLTARKATGVAVGFAGVVTVIGPAALTHFDPTSLAQIALIGAALSYALAAAWARATLGGVRAEVAAAGMLTGSSLIMVPLALWHDGWPALAQPWRVWAGLAHLALMSTAIAYLLYYRLIRGAGAGNASLTTLLVAPVAIVLGAMVFGETLPLRAYLGFAVLAAGLLILDGRLLARLHIPPRTKPREPLPKRP